MPRGEEDRCGRTPLCEGPSKVGFPDREEGRGGQGCRVRRGTRCPIGRSFTLGCLHQMGKYFMPQHVQLKIVKMIDFMLWIFPHTHTQKDMSLERLGTDFLATWPIRSFFGQTG